MEVVQCLPVLPSRRKLVSPKNTYPTTHQWGANLVANGATFRVWARRAERVYVTGDFNAWTPSDPWLLQTRPGGHGAGFLPELNDGSFYKFWVQAGFLLVARKAHAAAE